MKNKKICGLLLAILTATSIIDHVRAAAPDYLEAYRTLLTPVWTQPFSYAEVRSNHAPGGPFLGNGEVGVVAHTAYNAQTLRISKVNFVTDGWADWAGTGAAALPAAEVCITVDAPQAAGFHYEMSEPEACLRMRTATRQPVELRTWLTMDEDLIVTEVHNLSADPVAIRVDTRALTHPLLEAKAAIRDDLAQVTRRSRADGQVRWVSRVGVSTRIVGPAAACIASDTLPCIRQRFSLPAAGTAYVVVAVTGGGKGDDARLEEGQKALKSLSAAHLRQKAEAHRRWWDEMWHRSWVDAGDSLLNRQYLSSLYLLASAYSPRTTACGGMYGVWNMEDDMMYHGDIHLNYNSQAGFYSLFSANRPELALPYFDFLERMVPEGRRRAREEMGLVHPSLAGKECRGILFPVSALGIGEFYGEYWQQTMDAPFNVPLFSWYYEYTGDLDFLRRRAYPFIRECGDFYEDYLQRETTGSSYRYAITTGGHEGSWDQNPPSELALVECTFRLLLRYSRLLGVDADRRALWQDIVDHLPAYKIIQPTRTPNQGLPVFAKNDAGWDLPAHIIQLHCAYPCETMDLNSDSTALEVARNTLYYYGVSQRGLTETMNELGLSAYVMGARVQFSPALLKDGLRTLCGRADKNLLIRDGHHCLEKTAIVETLHSMMLQSVDSVLHLFPCWDTTPASFTRLRTKGAFLVSAEFDGQSVGSLSIRSDRGNLCRLQNPWPGRGVEVRCGRRKVAVRQCGGEVQFPTCPGCTYRIAPAAGH